MLAYLAAPIDFAHARSRNRELARDALERQGFAVFDPSRPWTAPMKDAHAVTDVNEFALERADAVLALLPVGVSSVGTPMEIQAAWQVGKPVATVGGSGSVQLAGMHPGVEVFGHDDFEEAAILLAARVEDDQGRSGPSELRFVGEEEFTPTRSYPGDAGLDLYCSEPMVIYPGHSVDVPCGVRVELPIGLWARITGRSSTIRDKELLVIEGVIDNGWRGPLFAAVHNIGTTKQEVKRGERIAQLIPMPVINLRPRRVERLSISERGERGFGSTGR